MSDASSTCTRPGPLDTLPIAVARGVLERLNHPALTSLFCSHFAAVPLVLAHHKRVSCVLAYDDERIGWGMGIRGVRAVREPRWDVLGRLLGAVACEDLQLCIAAEHDLGAAPDDLLRSVTTLDVLGEYASNACIPYTRMPRLSEVTLAYTGDSDTLTDAHTVMQGRPPTVHVWRDVTRPWGALVFYG